MIQFRAYTEDQKEAVSYILEHLRFDDQTMLEDYGDYDFWTEQVYKALECYVGYYNGTPCTLYGLNDRYPFNGWKIQAFHVSTDVMDKQKIFFVKAMREQFYKWIDKYKAILVAVNSNYAKSFTMAKAMRLRFIATVDEKYVFLADERNVMYKSYKQKEQVNVLKNK